MPTASEIALLNSDEINPDRRKTNNLVASFFRGEDDGLDYCKITNMHDQGKNDVVQRVNASHIGRWPKLWEAYQYGRTRAAPSGTPLRQVIGLDEATSLVLKLHNINNAEALATLDDAMLAAVLGQPGVNLRASARQMMRLKEYEELEKQQSQSEALAESDERDIPEVAAEAGAGVVAEMSRAERLREIAVKQGRSPPRQ